METLFVVLVGMVAAILANRNIAVFNDGLRPIVGEHLEGNINRRDLALTAFAMGFGLVVGFGIPFTVTASIILVHSILLGTDIIGLAVPKNKWGTPIAAIIGGMYGLGLQLGLQWIVTIFEKLPVNVMDAMESVGEPVILSFMAFPALAIAFQFSVKKGILTFIVAGFFRQATVFINESEYISFGGNPVEVNQEGIALIVGMIFLLYFALKEKAEEDSSAADLATMFSDKVKSIRGNVMYFVIIGALIAGATNLMLMAGDPISLGLLAEGHKFDAGIAAAARMVGFIPLVASTAIATGVYSPVGFTTIFVVGLFSPNVVLAIILGAIVIFLEVMLLSYISKFLDKYPGMRNAGGNIRDAMTRLLEVALLIGGANASNMMAPGLGFFFIAGFYLLNEAAGRPIVRMAVGPIGAIIVGIIANILVAAGLMTV